MALATAMVNSPDVFQCLASASLTVVWASAGTANARISNRFVFMIASGLSVISQKGRRGQTAGIHERSRQPVHASPCRARAKGFHNAWDLKIRSVLSIAPLIRGLILGSVLRYGGGDFLDQFGAGGGLRAVAF